MKYNVDFEIMGLIITFVVLIYFNLNYVIRTRTDKAFNRLLYFIIFSCALDMITAYTISLENPGLNILNNIMTMGYFFCAFLTAVSFEEYIVSYIYEKRNLGVLEILRRVIIVLYTLHGLLNPFTGLAFYFTPEGKYVHGTLYMLGYYIPALFVISSLYHIFRYHKKFDRKQWISGIAFMVVVLVGMVLQATVLPNVYLTFGLVPVALLMIVFSLETPDYRKLVKTLDELEEARQSAWKANQVKSDFLANMSHEIRTPINAVLGFDEMILRESQEEDTITYARNIKSSGQTLLSIVNDILDLSKIEAGKMDIVSAEYDLVSMISGLLKMITPRAAEKGLRINCNIDDKLPRKLCGDEVRIAQVLSNLLTNAVKYTKMGEVTLEIKVKDYSKDNINVYFAVKDTGIGIKEENMENLFSEFARVESEGAHDIEGTGLGLPISMKCLELMGSKLEVESTYGEGSVFYFEITQGVEQQEAIGDFMKANAENIEEVPVFREEFTAPEAHILVVDDVEMNIKVFKGLMKKSMIQIDEAMSGAQAIELIKSNKYDCIFMDHQMPEMDGIKTLDKLREDDEVNIENTPVIALTANAISGAREMYLQHGFSDYLSKPIDGWELSGMLHKWIPEDKIHEGTEGTTKTETAEETSLNEEKGSEADIASENNNYNNDDNDEIMEFFPEGNDYYADSAMAGSAGTDVFQRLEAIGIDVELGLTYSMNEQDFYLEILNDFVINAREMLGELETSFQKEDWKNYEIKAHAMKSTAKTIGARDLSEAAKDLEFAAKEENYALIQTRHGAFTDQYSEVSAKIEAIIV